LLDTCLELIYFVSSKEGCHLNEFITSTGRTDRVYPYRARSLLVKGGLLTTQRPLRPKKRNQKPLGKGNPLHLASYGLDLADLKNSIDQFKSSYQDLESIIINQTSVGIDNRLFFTGVQEADKRSNQLTILSGSSTLLKAWISFVETVVARYAVLWSFFSNILSKKLLDRLVHAALSEHFSAANSGENRLGVEFSTLNRAVSKHISEIYDGLAKVTIHRELHRLEDALRKILRSDEPSPTYKRGMKLMQDMFQKDQNHIQEKNSGQLHASRKQKSR
jgi:hypothetical protein